jgi:hypothetical protein
MVMTGASVSVIPCPRDVCIIETGRCEDRLALTNIASHLPFIVLNERGDDCVYGKTLY